MEPKGFPPTAEEVKARLTEREHAGLKAVLPINADERKAVPLCSGVLDYFPKALAEVARVSEAGNRQHNPGQPLHWARGKSTDFSDTIIRHMVERGTRDVDGMRHTAKAAWRILAMLEVEIEEQEGKPISRGSTA
jgi:hypothetical protein